MSAEISPVAFQKSAELSQSSPTRVSNEFIANKIGRGIGHAFRTAVGEGLAIPGAIALPTFAYHLRDMVAPIATVSSNLAASAPNLPFLQDAATFIASSAGAHPYITSAVGYASWMLGNEIGWAGAKNAGPIERNLYTGIKIAAPILAGVGAFTQAPWAIPLAAGLSVASTALAMRHRA
ncbi:hypothetical protein A3J15_00900 [Candidatus Roizmanbacteria bacterium RIFCSPLOWO2_02_FULL_38_10]|uniref:Uncharacterized protein n=1 Tax=Candidatus Roizmanbacteria bacterium RIFCSPLOWO2_02_FULL_38_10 TaxID=1802074 RepID=A0A1F7JMU9_9BACT|nr:MAG: hypothetical protein A3J15_00900 [Candidatus Roizmanbacteria bacterium RIFCSPLOWO2_02_FULL_38_10]